MSLLNSDACYNVDEIKNYYEIPYPNIQETYTLPYTWKDKITKISVLEYTTY